MNITIFGAGAFGTATGKVLTDNQHKITYYDTKYHTSLEGALQDAEVLVFTVPSQNIQELIQQLPPKIQKLPAVIASKGLFSLSELSPLSHAYLLSGPAFASDLKAATPVTLTATNPIVQELFTTDYLSIELCSDALGVMLCGTLKNIYAIGAGLFTHTVDELSVYLDDVVQELKSYLENSGANPATVDLACGIGDLTLTSTSHKSRNLRCGQKLAARQSLETIKAELGTIEGLAALKKVEQNNYPIIQKIYNEVFK